MQIKQDFRHLANRRLLVHLLALKRAESRYGTDSLEVGLSLLELSSCVQALGLGALADDCAERATSILREFLKRRPDILSDLIGQS